MVLRENAGLSERVLRHVEARGEFTSAELQQLRQHGEIGIPARDAQAWRLLASEPEVASAIASRVPAYQQAAKDFLAYSKESRAVEASTGWSGGVARVSEADLFGTNAELKSRVLAASEMASATADKPFVLLLADGDRLIVVGGRRTSGTTTYVVGTINEPETAGGKSAIVGLAQAQQRRTAAVFIDETATAAVARAGVDVDSLGTYRGPLSAVAAREHVYVASETMRADLAGITNQPIARLRRRVLNFVDDVDTRAALKRELPPEVVVESSRYTMKEIQREFKAHADSLVFILAHLERDHLVLSGDLRIPIAAVEKAARDQRVIPFFMGCNSAEGHSGVIGQINSVRAVRQLRAAHDAATFGDMLDSLASSSSPIVIRSELIEGTKRILAGTVKADAAAESAAGELGREVLLVFEHVPGGARLASVRLGSAALASSSSNPAGPSPSQTLAAAADGGTLGADPGELPVEPKVEPVDVPTPGAGRFPWAAIGLGVASMLGAPLIYRSIRRRTKSDDD